MHTVFNELIDEWDEIESIEYIGEEDTLDINVSGNRLFYANGILTHNSAVDEMEFDHSHISGGLSKIMTADNVIGIFTSRAMKERGKYQIQFMKTRSSSGVGQKVELEFNTETLRITDEDSSENGSVSGSQQQRGGPTSSVYQGLQRTSNMTEHTDEDGVITQVLDKGNKVPKAQVRVTGAPLMRSMLKNINPEKD